MIVVIQLVRILIQEALDKQKRLRRISVMLLMNYSVD